MSLPANIAPRFISVWDGGTEIETACTIDLVSGVVTPVIAADGVELQVSTLDSQRVMLGEFSIEVVDVDGEICISRPTELPVLALFAASLEELPAYVDLESFIEHSANPSANTQVEYMYRDAGNYKQFKQFVFKGIITPSQIKIISQSFLPDFEPTDFLPRQVGLLPLCPWTDDENYDDDLDHMIHTIETIKLVDSPADTDLHPADLANKFAAAIADGWDMVKYGNEHY